MFGLWGKTKKYYRDIICSNCGKFMNVTQDIGKEIDLEELKSMKCPQCECTGHFKFYD